MISKPYEWDGVLTNIQPIALIKTVCKILSKILLNRILSACSTFDVLHEDNFSVLRDTMIQSPIFAIGSVVEDILEKSHEFWLVLQDMWKTYDSVGLVRIKMCSRFIRFFGGIYNDHVNRVMTDFGLTDRYRVHNSLDQKEVFSPLLWPIFYDPLLCEVKRQADRCGYKLNFYFISGCGHAKSWAGLFFFFAMGAFVNNTIWTVVIFINYKIADSSLLISRSPIFIAKRGKSHCYLGIYLSTEGLSKLSLAKAHSDVWFFANLVLKKTVSDKQTQFSYVSVNACKKWDTLIHKDLKSKSGLLCPLLASTLFFAVPGSCQDRSLSDLGFVDMKVGAVVFFGNIGIGLSVGVSGLMFSTLTELQAIALAFECVPPSCSINLFSDSQAALDACKLELDLALHLWLTIAVHKQLYNKSYSSVVCLFCGDVKVLDHAFSCLFDANNCARLLDSYALA
ncbi:hypothetical protein G9A89_014628 [Geosiphon pyriformis]|nr:hypothetical protein G9A89_014628 [Geosiphon pyriformis]